MHEQKVLSAVIQDRRAYDTVSQHYEQDDFSDVGELVYKEVVAYYHKDSKAQYADTESLLHRMGSKYTKHKDKFAKFIDSLTDVSIDNVLDDYRDMKMTSCAELAGSYLIAGDFNKAQPLLDKYNKLKAEGLVSSADAPSVFCDADVDDFSETLELGNRIPIAPTALNNAIGGGLIAGCHVLVYAPPECGKTAVAINLAYSIARKGRKVLYIGNEEASAMYQIRMLCRFTRWTDTKVLANKAEAMVLARKRGWKHLTFAHMASHNVAQVQAVILEHKPEVVVVDQLSNLMLGKGKEPEKAQLLDKLAHEMRMFYSAHKIAGISIAQADEKAIGKLYLTIRDVFFSNIAVQGHTDVMIGIGMNNEYEQMSRRMMTITKNKLGGEHTSIPVQLHSKISAIQGI